MPNYNRVILMGHLGRDPEAKTIPSGKNLCNFSIAVTAGYGEHKRTSWFDVIAWGKTADYCMKYLKKGAAVHLDGKIEVRDFEAKDGTKKRKVEVTVDQINEVGRRENQSGAAESPPAADDLGGLPF